MKKVLSLLMLALFVVAIMSCEEKKPGDKVKDGVEEIGDGIEDAAEDVGESMDNAGDSMEEAAEDVDNEMK